MNRLGAILYGVAVGGIALLSARNSLEPAIWLFEEYAGETITLAVAGWLIATLGPLALSVGVWLMARRLKARWLLHLIFIPTAIVIARQGALLFFYGTGSSGDGMPEGFALMMAAMLLTLTLLVHAVALVVEAYRNARTRRAATDRG